MFAAKTLKVQGLESIIILIITDLLIKKVHSSTNGLLQRRNNGAYFSSRHIYCKAGIA